jgi:hypothetical protein
MSRAIPLLPIWAIRRLLQSDLLLVFMHIMLISYTQAYVDPYSVTLSDFQLYSAIRKEVLSDYRTLLKAFFYIHYR